MGLRAKVVRGLVVGLVCMGVGGVLPLRRAVGQAPQAAAAPMQFEVVSIKANATGRRGTSG